MKIGYSLDFEQFMEWLPLILPFVLLQIILIIVALRDLLKSERSNEHKWLWSAVIVFISIFGPIAYFVLGRRDRS